MLMNPYLAMNWLYISNRVLKTTYNEDCYHFSPLLVFHSRNKLTTINIIAIQAHALLIESRHFNFVNLRGLNFQK